MPSFVIGFSQLITHAAARGQLRGRSENGGAPAGRAKIVDNPLDDSDPTFRGTVYALVIVTVFCSAALAVVVVQLTITADGGQVSR